MMPLSDQHLENVADVLRNSLRNKFQQYKPEPASMPFHARLLGKDRMALFSFIHSLNTNFGTTIYEPIAKAIASQNFKIALSQQKAGDIISSKAQEAIQTIMDNLTTAKTTPDKIKEIQTINAVAQQGVMKSVNLTKVDILLTSHDGTFYLFDIKTAKPNIGDFRGFKRTLLEWTATKLASEPNSKVKTLIAIPYNPYEPHPYERWTIRGMLDINEELKVGEEFWDFLGGEGTYEQLLDVFQKVGIELRPEIDAYFAKYT